MPGVAIASELATMIVASAGRAVYRMSDPKDLLDDAFDRVADVIRDAAVAAHLDAMLRINLICDTCLKKNIARRRGKGFAFAVSSVYDTAVKFTQMRLDLSLDEIEALQAMYGENATRLAKSLQNLTAGEIGDAINEAVREGLPPRTAVARLNKALVNTGLDPAKPWQLETAFRTQTGMAYEAGRWEALQTDVAQDLIWGFEYVTVGDDRVRPNHAAMDGIRLPKDDSFWTQNWPPNGFNCRCSTIELLFDDVDAKEVPPPSGPVEQGGMVVEAKADAGWDFNPGKVFESMQGR